MLKEEREATQYARLRRERYRGPSQGVGGLHEINKEVTLIKVLGPQAAAHKAQEMNLLALFVVPFVVSLRYPLNETPQQQQSQHHLKNNDHAISETENCARHYESFTGRYRTVY